MHHIDKSTQLACLGAFKAFCLIILVLPLKKVTMYLVMLLLYLT